MAIDRRLKKGATLLLSRQAGFLFESLFRHSASLVPQGVLGQLGWLRGSLGAAVAIAVAGLTTAMLMQNQAADLPWLIAPLGASAVLVFAVPASPLAQPWSVIGGNFISAVIGLALGIWIGEPIMAASLAVGLAIAMMTFARCLHPPGGACALLCALGAAGTDGWTYVYLMPIMSNVIVLALVGWAFNNLTGHRWPHVIIPALPPSAADGVLHTREDIEATLAGWNELLDVDVDDLDAFYRALNERVSERRNGR
ncbi:MAG TPA: HPP family protein [Erythrobacter sp.]|nr:HPP family protein [Erythrobacter sp.]